jgi:hypothetical protein
MWSVPLGRVHKVFIVAMPWSGEHRDFVVAAILKNVHLSGTVNKQHFRYWAAENPRELHAPLYSPKVTVTLSSIGVTEPYIF